MKLLKCFLIEAGVMLLGGAVAVSALDPSSKQVLIEAKVIELDWAQAQAVGMTGADSTADDQAWAAFWRNRAGGLGSEVVAMRLASKTGQTFEAPPSAPGESIRPPPPSDPNAKFRAAATPEENLARVPAPNLNLQSDYVPQPRPGETIGISVDYAKIETMIHRYPVEPTSTVPIIPPMFGPGWGGPGPMPGWGGYGPGAWGGPWPGYIGFGGWHRPWAPSCMSAPPVCFNPCGYGGISGGFFYRSRHFGAGFGIGF